MAERSELRATLAVLAGCIVLVCAGVNSFWAASFGMTYLFGDNGDGVAVVVPFAFFAGLTILLPAGIVAIARKTGRFWVGSVAAVLGQALGCVVSIPVASMLGHWAYRGETGGNLGQGIGLVALFLVVVGVAASPIVGALAALAGVLLDRLRGTRDPHDAEARPG